MLAATPTLVCTAKPDPRPWTQGNRSGITYRVTLSDGKKSFDLRCANDNVYNKFIPFEKYDVTLDIQQAAEDSRLVERVRVVDCVAMD